MRQRSKKERKSIAIIGEGLTEYRYVDDMRTTERYRFSLVPGIPKHSDEGGRGQVPDTGADTGNQILCMNPRPIPVSLSN